MPAAAPGGSPHDRLRAALPGSPGTRPGLGRPRRGVASMSSGVSRAVRRRGRRRSGSRHRSPTKMSATPEAAPGRPARGSCRSPRGGTGRAHWRPSASSPTAVRKTTSAPARRAATAWLAPLPPGPVWNVPPRHVSPAAGRRGRRTVMSVLLDPRTTTSGMASRLPRCPAWGVSPVPAADCNGSRMRGDRGRFPAGPGPARVSQGAGPRCARLVAPEQALRGIHGLAARAPHGRWWLRPVRHSRRPRRDQEGLPGAALRAPLSG